LSPDLTLLKVLNNQPSASHSCEEDKKKQRTILLVFSEFYGEQTEKKRQENRRIERKLEARFGSSFQEEEEVKSRVKEYWRRALK
jgi:hypothetical protein